MTAWYKGGRVVEVLREALGLQGPVRRIRIEADSEGMATVEVEYYPEPGRVEKVGRKLRRYVLTERPET
jgi:hypothetical protein